MMVRYAAAAARGQQHLLEGRPCQDFAAGRAAGRAAAVCLCDGAGSCPHSERAAECVCDWALRLLPACFDELYGVSEDELADILVAGGQAALQEAGLPDGLCTMLLMACHEDGRWMAAHIGDGYIFVEERGASRVLSYPENGSFANETFFLCEAGAREHLRVYRGRAEARFAALLTSDGCGGALYDLGKKAPAPAVPVLCGWLADHDGAAVSLAVEAQLTELFSVESDDDLSMALLYRDAAWAPEAGE